MNLPQTLGDTLQPLFELLPIEEAMQQLVVNENPASEAHDCLSKILPTANLRLTLVAGLWLYVDDLDRSHRISQKIDTPTGSFWHGIMHRREGDFSNSHYWFHRTGIHPAMATMEGYEPHAFVDAVDAATPGSESALEDLQRREWAALFQWCAKDETE